jgi:hypothetical protein
VQAYIQQHPPYETEQGRAMPIFYAVLPPPQANRRPSSLVKSLLQQFNDPWWDTHEPIWEKEERLKQCFLASQVELAILDNFHHAVSPHGRPLTQLMEWLIWFFESCVRTVPLLIVGEPTRIKQLLFTNGRFLTRFWRLSLPGEPEEQGDPKAEERWRKVLGIPAEEDLSSSFDHTVDDG